MYSTTWGVNGKTIEITSDYMGDAPAPWNEENWDRNEITVTVGDATETFEAWGSQRDREFYGEYQVKNIFQMICNDALNIIWDEIDDMVDGMPYRKAKDVVDRCTAAAEKLQKLGLDEDDLTEIVNDEEWQ